MKTTTNKPKAKLVGENGNVFNLMAICGRALKQAGQGDKVKEMNDRIYACGSYEAALAIMGEYCETY